ncbi:MAG: RDD family protein [Acidobacteria bacterium]|nr:RDD family protein [Acidobacteriota bacterium]
MQCAACHADYPSVFAQCPQCLAPVAANIAEDLLPIPANAAASAAKTAANAPGASTLIEFPGKGRAKPQWRKELSERVREIQQRRALEAAREAGEEPALLPAETSSQEFAHAATTTTTMPLGLVPPADAPQINPLVVAALKRIERARQQPLPPIARGGKRGSAATAAAFARVEEENYQLADEPLLTIEAQTLEPPVLTPLLAEAEITTTEAPVQPEPSEHQSDDVRTPTLVVVPPTPPPAEAFDAVPPANILPADAPPFAVPIEKPVPRRVTNVVIDDNYLARREAAQAAARLSFTHDGAVALDDRAPFGKRIVAGLVDLLLVGVLSSPSAMIIEMTNGNWSDIRVIASLAGVALTVMFFYLTIATAATGRSVGQRLLSLRTVDARNGLIPTVGQCARRAFVFILSLALAGAGLLFAFIDAEGRALHDHFSGTITVRD